MFMDTIKEVWAWAKVHKKTSIAIAMVIVLLIIAAQ